MPEEKAHASGSKSVELTAGLIMVVASYMYIHEQLLSQHLIDVLIAVLVFGIGLIFLYRHYR